MRLRVSLAALLALLVGASASRGQAPRDDPRIVADSFFRLIGAERFPEAARLMDVDAFDAFRQRNLGMARNSSRLRRRITAADFRRADPTIPRAVAEYQARKFNEHLRSMPSPSLSEFGYQSLDSLASAAPGDALARWLEVHDIRFQMRRALAERGHAGCPAPTKEELERAARPIALRSPRVIGVSTDGDSVAWVLHDEPSTDASLMEQLYGEPLPRDSAATAHASTLANPRPWQEVPPSITVLRAVRGRWLVGSTIESGAMGGFATFCEPSRGTRRSITSRQ